MAGKINVLILEDNQMQFENMRQCIKEHLDNHVNVYPLKIDDMERTLDSWNYFIEQLQKSNFPQILKHYDKLNLVIIDVNLKGPVDDAGYGFRDYMRANGFLKTEILFVSNNMRMGKGKSGNNEGFISKAVEGRHFPRAVVEFIMMKFNLIPGQEAKAPEDNGRQDSPVKKSKSWRKKIFGRDYFFHWLRKKAEADTVRVIDKIILFVFYVLIVMTTLWAGTNIFLEFSPVKTKSPEQKGDTAILSNAEHIFLYLLPVFIVFGFYNYYKINSRAYLLEAYTQNIDEVESTRGMNITKVLFISSIISYVLIKVIEELFKDPEKDITQFRLYKLIGSGILLLLLMGYFIFLDKHNRQKSNYTGKQ